MPIILELTLHSKSDQRFQVDARLSGEDNTTDLVFGHALPLALDLRQLLTYSTDLHHYGTLLSTMLFADPRMYRAWRCARGYADAYAAPLTIGIRIIDDHSILHSVGWELLCDPDSGQRLGISERTLIVRYCNLERPIPMIRHQRSQVGQVIAVASPHNLSDYGLPTLPTGEIVDGARQDRTAYTGIVLDGSNRFRRASLPNIMAAMRGGPRMLYLVCHGSTVNGEHFLWLEDESGAAKPTSAAEVVEAIAALSVQPPLIAILACDGAGRLQNDSVSWTLGPRLMHAGMPAVLLFRDRVSLEVGSSLMPVFWRELDRDGAAARALGAARHSVGNNAWAQPVLWTRARDGSIWAGA